MKTITKLMLVAGVIASYQLGCGDDTDNDREPITTDPAGTDSNSDVGGTDTTLTGPCMLKADDNGWIARDTNSCGVQGGWFEYPDKKEGGSSIERYVSATGAMCAKGTAAMADPPTWSIWGAGLGFTLCAEGDESEATISTCTASPGLADMTGFRIVLSGTIGTLRVTPGEADATEENGLRKENTFITADQADADAKTPVDYLFSESTVEYSSSAPPINVDQIRSLQFQVASSETKDTPFDFCVESIEVLFGDAAGGDTDSATDTDSM
jgi:hypothetical protein